MSNSVATPFLRARPPRSTAPALARGAALWVIAALVAQTPLPVQAAQGPAISEAAQAAYDRGLAERDAGRHAAAAREFASAYAQIAESQRELRAAVLFDLVEAHRAAYKAGGERRGSEHPAAHLCAADRALADFLEAEQQRGKKGKRSPDAAKAAELREDVRKAFAGAKASESDLDCAALELPRDESEDATPAPTSASEGPQDRAAPRRGPSPETLLIAGGVTAGVGLIFTGLMIGGLARGGRAEAEGASLVREDSTLASDDPLLQEIDRRGRSGNAMAIAGAVIGTLALGAGATLLALGIVGKQRQKQQRQVAAGPLYVPRGAGLTLRWAF